jgi:hypothetical protein
LPSLPGSPNHIPVHVIIAERIKALHTVDTGINGYSSGGMIQVMGAAVWL